nr:type VII secretion-associated protein [Actinomycetes bacterium]
MNAAVIEVGPQTVLGPDPAPREWISVAIECVDDDVALLGGGLVEVGRLWRDLLKTVAGEHPVTPVLVVPTWWSSARVALVTGAARGIAADVVVLRRASVLGAEGATTVVELAEEFVVIAAPAAEVEVLPRAECEVARYLAGEREVLIDVPAEVAPPAPVIAARLRADGIPVTYSDRQRMMRSVSAQLVRRGAPEHRRG